MGAADPTLGTAAKTLIEALERREPNEPNPHLVHGTLCARHVLDLGDATGLIDWDRSARGPLELDAGMFLASIRRCALADEALADEAALAERAFLSGIAAVVDERALAWHRAAALLRLTEKYVLHRPDDWLARAHVLLSEATRLVKPPDARCLNLLWPNPNTYPLKRGRAVIGCVTGRIGDKLEVWCPGNPLSRSKIRRRN